MRTVLLLVLALMFVSCSHKQHKSEIKKQVEQSSVKDPSALSVTIDEAIESSPNLSAEQKQELHKIIEANKQKATQLAEESFKLRGVLIQELLSGNKSDRKVRLLKKDIKNIEDQKLKNTFETVEKISRMVTKKADGQRFAEPLLNMDKLY